MLVSVANTMMLLKWLDLTLLPMLILATKYNLKVIATYQMWDHFSKMHEAPYDNHTRVKGLFIHLFFHDKAG